MSKIRKLMTEIPFRVGMSLDKAAKVSAVFGMLYDYEVDDAGPEFKRIGDSMEDCQKRLSVVFDLLDANARDENAVLDAKSLLLLASTPDKNAQEAVSLEYGEVGETFSDVLTVEDAAEIGVRGYWNQ